MKKLYFIAGTFLLVAAGMVFTQCQKTDTSSPYDVNLANSTTLGSVLTDKDGNTLYFFAMDANGLNNCTSGCTTTVLKGTRPKDKVSRDTGVLRPGYRSPGTRQPGQGIRQLYYDP